MSAEISTTDWGFFWIRPGAWAQSVPSGRTPGSDGFSSHRVYNPHVYPFLDGCDMRDYVPAHSGNVPSTNSPTAQQPNSTNSPTAQQPNSTNSPTAQQPNSPTAHTNLTSRLTHWGEMIERARLLQQMKVGTNDVLWGSSAMDDVCASNGAPAQADLNWTANPLASCYDADAGSAWMPCFRTLQSGNFGNEWYDDWMSGVAVILGWRGVNLKEPGHDLTSFSAYVDGDYPATPSTRMDDVIDATFATNFPSAINSPTYRIHYPFVSVAHQTLSLFDRTYHQPPDLVAVTNEQRGAGSVLWTYDGTPNGPVKVVGGEVVIPDGSGAEPAFEVDFAQTSTTNFLFVTNWPCSWISPRAAVSPVTGNATASGSTNEVAKISLGIDDVYWLASAAYGGSIFGTHTFVIHARPGDDIVEFWVDYNGNASSTNTRYTAVPPDGDYELPFKGESNAGYYFRSALDLAPQPNRPADQQPNSPTAQQPNSPAAQQPNSPAALSTWLYPSNLEYVVSYGLRHSFFRSCAATSSYKGAGQWDDVDFDWGQGADWQDQCGYYYAHNSVDAGSPTSYPGNLFDALGLNLNRCRAIVGNDFDRNSRTYCGVTDDEANDWVDGCNWNWTGHLAWQCLGQPCANTNEEITANFTVSGNGLRYTMDPPELVISSVGIAVSGGYEPSPAKYAKSVETRIKPVIEVNWDFPQVKRSN